MQRVVFSGIQPTGVPHIGNHLGTLAEWQRLGKSSTDTLIFSVVGLHALTVPRSAVELRAGRRDMFAVLLSLGLGPNTILFHQDSLPQHTELAWHLACLTPLNRLNRISTHAATPTMLGQLSYPVLQAADILLYQATHVPIGHDQQQHLELARVLAQTFNRHTQSELFPLPQSILTHHPRIQSLRDPTRKMSKSDPDQNGKILLTDSPEVILSKFKVARTDSIEGVSYDPVERPALAALLEIHSAYSGEDVHAISKRFAHARGIRDFKLDCAEAVSEALRPFREEYTRIRPDEGYIISKEKEGAGKAREIAEGVMQKVRHLVGID